MTTPREFIPIPGMQRTAPRRYETVAPRYAPVAEGLIGTGMRVPPELQTIAEEIGGRGTRIKDANLFSLFVKESAIEFNKFDLNTFMGRSDSPFRKEFFRRIQNPSTQDDHGYLSIIAKRGFEPAYTIYLGKKEFEISPEVQALLDEKGIDHYEWLKKGESLFAAAGAKPHILPTGETDYINKNLDREQLYEVAQSPEVLARRVEAAGPTRGVVPMLGV